MGGSVRLWFAARHGEEFEPLILAPPSENLSPGQLMARGRTGGTACGESATRRSRTVD